MIQVSGKELSTSSLAPSLPPRKDIKSEIYLVKYKKIRRAIARGAQKHIQKLLTSTRTKNDSDAKIGPTNKLSGVVRSVNQSAPPFLNDGTFSTMFEI